MKYLKTVFTLAFVALLSAGMSSCKEDEEEQKGNTPDNGDYVDLGLSSGTKWKTTNQENSANPEHDYFTYDEAMSRFGDKLPSKDQCIELINECEWTWTGSGYNITGSNGKSITMPAMGFYSYDYGNVNLYGKDGIYWSSTPYDENRAWIIGFKANNKYVDVQTRKNGYPVRLVKD